MRSCAATPSTAPRPGEALDKEKYEPVLLGVDKRGVWHLGADASLILNASNPKLIAVRADAPSVVPVEDATERSLALRDPESGLVRARVDVFFPIIHGTYGEDGSLQGLLRLLDAPFVGASVLGSAVGMDKDVMKRRDAGVPTARFVTLRSADQDFAPVVRELGLPLFAKPANLGSSVGVTKVKCAEDLRDAVLHALTFDRKVLVEEAVPGRFASLDALARRRMQDELLALWDDASPTLVFVTHAIDEAVRIGTRIVLLSPHPGRVCSRRSRPRHASAPRSSGSSPRR